MVKSRRTLLFYVDILLVTMSVGFFIHDHKIESIPAAIALAVWSLFILARLIKIGYGIEISSEEKLIRYKPWFQGAYLYGFDDIDGYVTGIITRPGKGRPIKDRCIWLVNHSILMKRVDGIYVDNFEFLLNEFESLTFLGHVEISSNVQFKLFFKRLSLVDEVVQPTPLMILNIGVKISGGK